MADGKVPELMVERLLLDELSPERRADIERREGSEALERRLQALRESNARILEAHPPVEMAARILARLHGEQEAGLADDDRSIRLARPRLQSMGTARLLAPLAAAAAVALAVLFLPRLMSAVSEPGASIPGLTRVKGSPQLEVYRQGRDGAELLASGAFVREGDVLQIKYVPSGRAYGAIVSVDGRGAVTLHYPDAVDGSTRLDGEGAHVLDFAYQLDDAPGFERFFFVTSRGSFSASTVVEAAKRLSRSGARVQALALPRGFEQVSELFVKEE